MVGGTFVVFCSSFQRRLLLKKGFILLQAEKLDCDQIWSKEVLLWRCINSKHLQKTNPTFVFPGSMADKVKCLCCCMIEQSQFSSSACLSFFKSLTLMLLTPTQSRLHSPQQM